MARYIRLYNDEEGENRVNITVVFGHDVGAWVEGRTPYNLMVGREMVADIQKRTRHNRYKMGNPYRWRETIKNIADKYNLKKEEKAVVRG